MNFAVVFTVSNPHMRGHDPRLPSADVARSSLQSSVTHVSLSAFLAAAVFLSLVLNIWVDEAYSLVTTDSGLGKALQTWEFQRQAPLYFWLLSVVRLIGSSIFVARTLSIAAVAAFLLAAGRLARHVGSPSLGLMAIPVFAAHPYAMWAATEIRVYGLALFVCGLLLLLEERSIAEPSERPIVVAAVTGLLWAVALYTHYYLAFVLVGIVVAGITTRGWRSLRDLGLKSVVALVAFVPLAITVVGQVTAASSDMARPGVVSAASAVYGYIKAYLFPWVNLVGETVGFIIGVVAVAGVFAWVVARRDRVRPRHLRLWITLGVTAALYVAAAAVVGLEAVKQRHAYPLLLLVVLSALTLAELVRDENRRRVVGHVLGVILFLSFLFTTVHDNAQLAKIGDYKRVAAYIEAHEVPNEPIVLFNAEAILPFEHYYAGPNVLLAIPSYPSLETFDPTTFVIESEDDVESAFASLGDDHSSIWLADNLISGWAGIDYDRQHLDEYLASRYVPVESTDFYEARVTRYERNQ